MSEPATTTAIRNMLASGGVKHVAADGTSVTTHTLKELIEADQYLRMVEAQDSQEDGLPFKTYQVVPPAGTGE